MDSDEIMSGIPEDRARVLDERRRDLMKAQARQAKSAADRDDAVASLARQVDFAVWFGVVVMAMWLVFKLFTLEAPA